MEKDNRIFLVRCGDLNYGYEAIRLLGKAIRTIIEDDYNKDVIILSSTVSPAKSGAESIFRQLQSMKVNVEFRTDTKLNMKIWQRKNGISKILELIKDNSDKIVIVVVDDSDFDRHYKDELEKENKCPVIKFLLEYFTSQEIGYKIEVEYPNPAGRFYVINTQGCDLDPKTKIIRLFGPFEVC